MCLGIMKSNASNWLSGALGYTSWANGLLHVHHWLLHIFLSFFLVAVVILVYFV
jgi:hypothetical protein